MKAVIIIWIGGGLGSALRYLAQVGVSKLIPVPFPLGTLLVNITGCFLIGLFYGLEAKYMVIPQEWRFFIATGVCGGYTTFSTFSYESIGLLRQGNYSLFFLYIVLSVCIGLLATIAGMNSIKGI